MVARGALAARIVLLALLVGALGACGKIQREYVWTRQEPAAARRSPTTFVVRISIDPASKSVVWFEDVHDADGDLGRNTHAWKNCTFLATDNWKCETGFVFGQHIPNDIEMKDGKLFQHYWGEERNFTVSRKIFGLSF
jgi:hypothetical protein